MLFAVEWPTAAIIIALILGIFAIPVGVVLMATAKDLKKEAGVARSRPGGQTQQAILTELKALREDVASLRQEVKELDRVLKSVE